MSLLILKSEGSTWNFCDKEKKPPNKKGRNIDEAFR